MRLQIISVEVFEKTWKNKDCILLDLREREKYEQGHIPNALWADWETLEENMEKILPLSRKDEKAVIMYCDRGNTSLLMARDIGRLGYHAISLGGGYQAWSYFQEQKHNYKIT